METLAEKFSVYDFFNPLIAGMTFLIAQGICLYPFLTKQLLNLFIIKKTVDAQIFIVVGVLVSAYIIGSVLQVPAHWIIRDKINYEGRLIENCLNSTELFSSKIRRDSIMNKAKTYFKYSGVYSYKDYCKAFFAYSVYYLQLKTLDAKPERMRETQALSELLSCVFFAVPIINFVILVILYRLGVKNSNCFLTIIMWMVCILLCFGFYRRYRMATRNRIRITLSLYDISVEQN